MSARFEPPSVRQRGQVANAMAAAYAQRQPDRDVKGEAACPRCGSKVSFTVMPSGISFGGCRAACGVKWTI